MSYVAQVEFFGLRKIAIRFYDEEGELTRLALESTKLRQRDKELGEHFMAASEPGKILMGPLSRKIAVRKIALHEKCLESAVNELHKSLKAGRMIAIEKSDRSFRKAEEREYEDVIEAAQCAHSAWLFIFDGDDMLADTNELVASAM